MHMLRLEKKVMSLARQNKVWENQELCRTVRIQISRKRQVSNFLEIIL